MTRITVAVPGAPVAAFDITLDETSPVQASMLAQLAQGSYEPATWAAIRAILRPGDTAIDVGAHVGLLSCLMACCVGETGQTVSFEPFPKNFHALEATLTRNGFLRSAAYQMAVGAVREYDQPLFQNLDNDGGHALYDPRAWECNAKTRAGPAMTVAVPMVPLDDFASLAPRLIKIDTEGAEYDVLHGALTMIHEHRPFIIAEINRFGLLQMHATEGDLRDVLNAMGYQSYLLWDFGGSRLRYLPLGATVQQDMIFNLLFVPPGASAPCVS